MSFHKTLEATPVKHIGLPEPTVVTPETTVSDSIALMRHVSSACAIVVAEGTLVGIVTERDVMNKVVGRPDVLPQPIREIMTSDPVSLSQDRTLGEAIEVMGRGHYRNLPVVDESGQVSAVLSVHAVVQFITEHFPQDVSNLPPRPDQHMATPDGA